jgi:hypothetical protein
LGGEGGDGAAIKLLKNLREEEIPKVVWAVVRNNHLVGFDLAILTHLHGGKGTNTYLSFLLIASLATA